MDKFHELDLPAVLYTPHREERWCKTVNATWHDLENSMRIRDDQVASQIEDNATFAYALDILKPLMESNPGMTVAEALDELGDL